MLGEWVLSSILADLKERISRECPFFAWPHSHNLVWHTTSHTFISHIKCESVAWGSVESPARSPAQRCPERPTAVGKQSQKISFLNLHGGLGSRKDWGWKWGERNPTTERRVKAGRIQVKMTHGMIKLGNSFLPEVRIVCAEDIRGWLHKGFGQIYKWSSPVWLLRRGVIYKLKKGSHRSESWCQTAHASVLLDGL